MADETQAERPMAERHEWGASEETNAPFFAIQNDGGHLWFWEGEDGTRVDAIIGGAFLAPAARELLRVVAERDTARERERERIRRELLEVIAELTVYVQWTTRPDGTGESKGVDDPFLSAADLRAAIDQIVPKEVSSGR